jgi:membrane-associated phospholipid phosphatase
MTPRDGTVVGVSAWWLPAVGAIAIAALLATGSNQSVFSHLNSWSRATGPAPWPYITILGDTAVAIALFLPLAMRRGKLLWALAVSAMLATLFVHGVKPLISIPRPPAVLAADAITVIGPAYRSNAFPSGHTTTIFLAAGLVWLHFRSVPLRTLAVVIALTVGLSRAVVGVHWPLDIAAGAIGGWSCAIFGTALAARWHIGHRKSAQVLLIALGGGCGIALLAGLRTGYPEAMPLQWIIGGLGLGSALLAARHLFRKH